MAPVHWLWGRTERGPRQLPPGAEGPRGEAAARAGSEVDGAPRRRSDGRPAAPTDVRRETAVGDAAPPTPSPVSPG